MDQMRHISPSTVEEAKRYLRGLIGRIDQGIATSAEHRPALEAIFLLPEPGDGDWLCLITRRMAAVYEHERHQRAIDRINEPVDSTPDSAGPSDH